jgi:hypothetical protein
MNEGKLPTQFGIFYPTGWIVVALDDKTNAERVQRDLFAGGYDAQDCMLVGASEVIPSAQGQLENSDWLGRLGKADEMVETHLRAAAGGSTFLIVYAPTESEAERVMNVVRRVPFQFAHRYRKFAIETLK